MSELKYLFYIRCALIIDKIRCIYSKQGTDIYDSFKKLFYISCAYIGGSVQLCTLPPIILFHDFSCYHFSGFCSQSQQICTITHIRDFSS